MDGYYYKQRLNLEDDIVSFGINDRRVLAAIARVPRHEFVPVESKSLSYSNIPLEIGHGQTISQPVMVALMTSLLRVEEGGMILEVGTGSGYQAAVLAELGARVYTVERIAILAERAKAILTKLGYNDRIRVFCADGSKGLKKFAGSEGFDGIIVTAAYRELPPELLRQLSLKEGRLVMPVGQPGLQELVLIKRVGVKFHRSGWGGCTFVPLIVNREK